MQALTAVAILVRHQPAHFAATRCMSRSKIVIKFHERGSRPRE